MKALMIWLTVVCLLSIFLLILLVASRDKKSVPKTLNVSNNQLEDNKQRQQQQHTCTLSCNSLDPLLDPSYNIKEVIKQTILLEEHIAFKNKRCVQCIFKHFLHIIALLNEAVWLAMDKVHHYPYLEESPKFYETQMEIYQHNQDNEPILLDILSKLREHRKKLVEVYYMHGN